MSPRGTAKKPATPPEATFITSRRTAGLNPLSIRETARRVEGITGGKFSEATLRNIEKGTVLAKAHHLAALAMVLRITAEELDKVGRSDSAELLRTELQAAMSQLPENASAETMERLGRALGDIKSMPGLTPAQRASMEEALVKHVNTLLELHQSQVESLRKQ